MPAKSASTGRASTGCARTTARGSDFSRTFQECRVLPEETCLDNVLFAAQDKRLGCAPARLRRYRAEPA